MKQETYKNAPCIALTNVTQAARRSVSTHQQTSYRTVRFITDYPVNTFDMVKIIF